MERHVAQEITQEEFSKILPLICTAETSADPDGWIPENPLWGHCAIVSAIGKDLFGGDMLRASLGGNPGFSKNDSHYWNRLQNGTEIDFTGEQFGERYPVLVNPIMRTREYVLFGPDDAKPDIKQRFENTRRRYKILVWRLAKMFYPQNQLLDDPIYQKCFFAALDSQCQKMRFGCVIAHNGKVVYEGCNSPLEPLRSFCEPKCIRFSITSRTESMIGACGHAEEGMWNVVKKGIPLEECELYIAGFYPNHLSWLKTKAEHTCLRCAVQMYHANIKTIYVPVREVKMNNSDVEIWEHISWKSMTAKQALETAREYAEKNICPPYYTIEQTLAMIDEPNRAACFRILSENLKLFQAVQGSTHNHQAWPGGYQDHVQEIMNIAVALYHPLHVRRPHQFSLSDALLVVFLHDIEKPWKYEIGPDGELQHIESLRTKEAHHEFRMKKLEEYGIVLTAGQLNAITYVEGELGDYTNRRRVMGPLAAFCHMCDIWSARGWFNYPLGQNDPWYGARRIRN